MTNHATKLNSASPVTELNRSLRLSGLARRRLGNLLVYAILGVGMIFTLLPLIWMLSASFKPDGDILVYPPNLWPKVWTTAHYAFVFFETEFPRFFLNSFIISVFTIAGHVISGSLVAFGFARLRFPGRNFLFLLLLSTLMIPFYAYMIPRFMIMRWLGLLDTLAAVFLPYLFGGPFYIFLMRQYIMTLPRDLDDAALIDGCSYFQIYWRIILPLASPILVTITVLEFLAAWTSFLEPLVYLNTHDNFTVALGLTQFRFGNGGIIQWGPLMAATALSALPPLIVCFLAQKNLVGGIAITGLKG